MEEERPTSIWNSNQDQIFWLHFPCGKNKKPVQKHNHPAGRLEQVSCLQLISHKMWMRFFSVESHTWVWLWLLPFFLFLPFLPMEMWLYPGSGLSHCTRQEAKADLTPQISRAQDWNSLVCLHLSAWSVPAARPQSQRMLFASFICAYVWELWCVFLYSLRVPHFSLLGLLSPQSFRPNRVPINDELSVTNHCLLFPAMPLFVSFNLQKQLNKSKVKVYI